jgi:hypothetical protein
MSYLNKKSNKYALSYEYSKEWKFMSKKDSKFCVSCEHFLVYKNVNISILELISYNIKISEF